MGLEVSLDGVSKSYDNYFIEKSVSILSCQISGEIIKTITHKSINITGIVTKIIPGVLNSLVLSVL